MLKKTINGALGAIGYRVARTNPPQPVDPELAQYGSCFGLDVFERRPLYNIGSGSFSHPAWTNIDYPSEWYASDQAGRLDIPWDATDGSEIPVASGSAEIVYTSHTIEHLPNAPVQHIFNEAHRMLRPGGFFRVTCPSIHIYHEAYKRKEPRLFPNPDAHPRFSFEQMFLNEFASQLSDICKIGNPRGASTISVPDHEVASAFSTMQVGLACDHFLSMCDYDLNKRSLVGGHINWWDADKISEFMRLAGFDDIRVSAYAQSMNPFLRNTQYFDNTRPDLSVYVEAIR